MSPSATVWLTDVFFIVFGQQWSSMAQRRKMDMDTHTLVGYIHCWFWPFYGIYIIEYCQTYPGVAKLSNARAQIFNLCTQVKKTFTFDTCWVSVEFQF